MSLQYGQGLTPVKIAKQGKSIQEEPTYLTDPHQLPAVTLQAEEHQMPTMMLPLQGGTAGISHWRFRSVTQSIVDDVVKINCFNASNFVVL